MKSTFLLAACAAAGFGCTGNPSTQVVTGKVTASGAVAVRAVADGKVITAGRVRTDGSFTLSLPAGNRYRLEVMTGTGVQHVVGRSGASLADLAFRVCAPTDPFDLGGVGSAGGGAGGGGCLCPPPPPPPPPPGCDPATHVGCPPPPPPPPPPPGCDPTTKEGCPPLCDPAQCPLPPPPCDPATDASCPPPPPPCDPTDPSAQCPPPPCDPTVDASCPVPPPPCADPTDPNSCKDPCMTDPAQCGCSANAPGCWPPPSPPPCDPNGTCKPDRSMTPDHQPGDFGCKGSNGS